MSEWYRRKAVQTAWQGAAVALAYVVLMRFVGLDSWGSSLEGGAVVVGIAALGVAFWVWRGRQVARHLGD
jgi:hypothetical protein